MKVVKAKPPNFHKIKAAFGVSENGMVFTYGDTLYVPDGRPVDEFLMAHEEEHSRQQGDNPEAWCDLYIKDPEFRKDMELPAYRKQYQAFARVNTNREANAHFAHRLASDMSGPMYGHCIAYADALRFIRS